MNVPRLSVVLCNYNDSVLLPQALEGILAQSFPPDELLVVDDGSTDGSVALLEGMAPRHPSLKIVRNDRNVGPARASKRGLESASGTYLYFAACDHRLDRDFFRTAMTALERHPEAGFCQTDYRSLDGQEYRFHLSPEPAYFSPREASRLCRRVGYWPGSGCSQIIRRDAVLEAGGIMPELRGLLDVFLSLAIAARRGFCYTPGAFMSVERREGAFSDRLRRWTEQRAVGEFLFGLLDTEPFRDVRDWIRRTGVWPQLQPYLICAILREPRRWPYLSLHALRQAVSDTGKTLLGGRLPLSMKRFLAGGRDRYRRFLRP